MNEPVLELYSPLLVTRDVTDGQFFHPHLPAWDDPDYEERDITPLITQQGFVVERVTPDEPWVDDCGGDAYWAGLRAWQPQPPDTSGTWLLAAVVDTEEGPQAWFVRRLNPVNQTDTE